MRNRKYVEFLVTGLAILFVIAAITPAISSQTAISENENIYSASSGRSWSDNFDTYTLGQFLDGDPTDGGWKGWDNDPTFGAFVVDDQALSSPHSLEVAFETDLIHEYSGYTQGQWTYIAWVFVPGDFVGNSYFMILSDYEDGQGAGNKWQFVMRFDADNQIVESENDGNFLHLKTNEWIEIRVEIDLDTDWFQLYYDDDLLVEREWTAGWDGSFDGFLVIDAVDLYASGASEIYYDDMSLTGDIPIAGLCCQGELNWLNVGAGKTVTGEFEVSNCGDDGSELDWEVDSYPEWGTGWTFTPASGTGLTPAQGWQTVSVELVAPDEEEAEFNGTVKVINSNYPEEFCEIKVELKTPRTRETINPFFLEIIKRLQNSFPLLRQLLGL